MGNGASGGSRMAITAMADMMKLTKQQLIDLRTECLRLSKSSSRGSSSKSSKNKRSFLSREDFHTAMREKNLDANDIDVLGHLYTMWDKNGDDKVGLLLFLSSISPLASTMDVESKLLFAFEIFDANNTGRLKRSEALKVLNGINSTASYFGDSVISTQAVDIIVEDIYKEQTEIFYEEYMDLFAAHPAVIQFASSGGTMKYSA
mmetsp:Transcript_9318/g.11697  ORF Transcript_9318/g.11697 Transcript_9318/m.11697 type:complete len:204 (+) Transcript_9318:138-749(+)